MKTSILTIFTISGALMVLAEENEYRMYREAVRMVANCGKREVSLCLKERALRYVDDLPDDIDLGAGFRIKGDLDRDRGDRFPSFTLPEESRAREEVIDNVLMERFTDYVRSHIIEFKVPDQAWNDVEEARKKKGGGMRMKSLMYLFYMKAALIGGLLLKFLTMVAFKALLLAKIALTISTAMALRKLLEGKSSSTYEVISHGGPYDDHGHYDRAFDMLKDGVKGHN